MDPILVETHDLSVMSSVVRCAPRPAEGATFRSVPFLNGSSGLNERSPSNNVDHFIKKYEGIQESEWCEGQFENPSGQRCASGWCQNRANGRRKSGTIGREEMALYEIFNQGTPISFSNNMVFKINDGCHPRFQQKTPRARILAALRDVKDGGIL